MSELPPCVVFEDEHLLVVDKPPGLNTHAPAPFAGEGIYDWLRNREPRWARLGIVHRLDKETSGVMVFPKTPLANRSLTEQFTQRAVRKSYLLLTDASVAKTNFTAVSSLVRVGSKYVARPVHAGGERAETRFAVIGPAGNRTAVRAEPVTGKTHQIRVQAAAAGFPIVGDVLYGGPPAARVCLHAEELTFRHPATGTEQRFGSPAQFDFNPRLALRAALIPASETNAYRLVHGAADGWPGVYLDRLGAYLLSQSEEGLSARQQRDIESLRREWDGRLCISAVQAEPSGAVALYHKLLRRRPNAAEATNASPRRVLGPEASPHFEVRENGLSFELSFQEGYSVGLFLDQRDNRRRLLHNYAGPDFPVFGKDAGEARVLNVFAYTCGFSVCAAKAGANTTSLDLSRKYLDWGKRNFALNDLDPNAHDFVFGDAFDWMRRWQKKQRTFDVILLDPPTFSRSKEGGTFRAVPDYERLVTAALPLLKPGGVLFASANAADFKAESFLAALNHSIGRAHRTATQQHFFPQPPDFPITRSEPAYLRTAWTRVA